MTEHMHQLEFAKDERGTITDFKSHSIPSEILESLMPWNMAWKIKSENLIRTFYNLNNQLNKGENLTLTSFNSILG